MGCVRKAEPIGPWLGPPCRGKAWASDASCATLSSDLPDALLLSCSLLFPAASKTPSQRFRASTNIRPVSMLLQGHKRPLFLRI